MNSSESIRIRQAGSRDARAIARTHCSAALRAFASIFPTDAVKPTPDSLLEGWRTLLDATDESRCFVVDTSVDGGIDGVVAVHPDPTAPTGLVLSRLYVEPRSWGSGIGSRLHDRALEHARSLGATSLNLWVLEANVRSRTMYRRWGWRYVPGPTVDNGHGVFDVLYERAL